MRAARKWISDSPSETIRRGRMIARMLRPGMVIALVGKLGSGKTTLVKGLALGLGVPSAREVRSPTFVIFHIYKGRIPLYHFDLYRISRPSDLDGIGLDEFLSDLNTISVIEWADRIPNVVKEADLKIELSRLSEKRRIIRIYQSESSKKRSQYACG